MKILHFKSTMRLEEGGVVKAVLDLCTMSQEKNQVGIATADSSGIPKHWHKPNPSTPTRHEINGTIPHNLRLNKQQHKQLESIIKQYDVVHLHSMWTPVNNQVASICSQLNKPYIISVHGMLDDWSMSKGTLKKKLYLKTIGRKTLQNAAVIHCTAKAELDQASAWFDRTKGHVVPLPLDLSEYQNIPNHQLAYDAFPILDTDLPKILFLSRIHYKKGVDRLLKASAILNEQGRKHQLVIVGTGDEPYVNQMKQLAQSLNIESHTYFLGFASGKQKVAILSACQAFALPTSQENFGFVFFEALASATFVVTTKGTDTWPEIKNSNGGSVINNTPEAFAQELGCILQNFPEYQARADQGRQWVLSEMDKDTIQTKYELLYQTVINSNESNK